MAIQGDPGQLFAAANSFGALADRSDQLRADLVGAADGVDGYAFNWQGPSSHEFADLLRALSQSLSDASQNFRQTAGALNDYAQKLEQAQQQEMASTAVLVVGIALTATAILQLGLDPVNDAAAAGADGGGAAAAAAARVAAEEAAAEAATTFTRIAEAAMAIVRGLVVPHLASAAMGAGQAAFVDLISTGRIDWRDVSTAAALAAVIGMPANSVESVVVSSEDSGLVRVATRWKPGDDIYARTMAGDEPAWNTVKARYWKNAANDPAQAAQWDEANLARMRQGLAPQRFNPDKGGMESMELSHEPIAYRDGGTDLVPRWPQDHAAVDPYRHPGY